MKRCEECDRSEAKAGSPLKSRRIRQPSGKVKVMRICHDCWKDAQMYGWDE